MLDVRSKRRRGLQSRLLISFVAMVASVIALVILIVDFRQRDVMLNLNQERGLAIGHSLSAAASSALLSYNYIALQQLTQRAVEEEGVGYVVILDKEGVVAGSSDHPERQGQRAAESYQPAVETTILPVSNADLAGGRGLEISLPVYVEGSPQCWGMVQVGISLDSMYAELARTRMWLLGTGFVVLLLAVLVARVMAMRIIGPINRLVEATAELARGNFDHRVNLTTGDEIEDLSNKFDGMAREIRLRQSQVEQTNQQLATLNASLEEKVDERTRALTEAEEKYRLLVEQSPNPICIIQGDHLVFFNKSFCDTFRFSETELADPDFDLIRIVAPDHHQRAVKLCADLLQGGDPEDGSTELVMQDRDGERIHMDVRSTAISYQGAPALEAILVDVTHQRHLQEKVVASERLRALGEMASGVAHDFNNVLGAILARSQFLQQRAEGTELLRGLKIIEKAAQDGAEAVKRIQEFSRVRTDRDFTAVCINSVIEDVAEMTRPQWGDEANLQGKQIRFERCMGEVPPVAGNTSELREVFMNLILNAVHAIPSEGTIKVSTGFEQDRVVVRVTDTGEGMSEDVQRRLFDPFFTTKGVGGNGLGMSIVFGILQRHGAKIDVSSQLHEGTEFRIELPVATALEGVHDRVVESVDMSGGDEAILVVDDEPEIRGLVRDILCSLGYAVTMAAGGAEAIVALSEQEFDLVITDLGMPGVSGWDVAERCHELSPNMPVLLLTGWGATLSPEDLERHHVDRALKKPFDMRELRVVIRDLLRRTNLRKSA